ncbi:ORC-CDC6 family AAA ATPase, partial [Psychroflexus sp. MES1-P1E]|uniref:ORC-CDC6 family AAA ATPase n=1 Tax=Psychroflexus sp. MES1-P1E TaxID=2058320 RepID=UPI000CB167E1
MENPFVFDRPNNVSIEQFIKFYIKENIYTKFLESTRNILLIGVRGSGKTSTLRYYSFPIQYANPEVSNKFDVVGIHIPSKHPLFSKREYLLYENNNKKSVVVEHFLCINIISCICETFIESSANLDLTKEIEELILKNLSFILESDFPQNTSLFKSIKLFLNKEANASQRKLNNENFESFIDFSFSFNNTVIPFLEQLKNIPKLKGSHFSLFFDDIQDLGKIHQEIINSWISYRDNKLFSFKVATADIKPSFITSTGGVILEGHDFVKIDLTKRLYNKDSEFSKFAKDVIAKRLVIAKIDSSVDDFLPESKNFRIGLDEGREKAREKAKEKYPNPKGTQINDYVAKYGRAIYFRERNSKANIPVYSGFETLVDISTGVIRNLLTPVYFMYEKQRANSSSDSIKLIPSNI